MARGPTAKTRKAVRDVIENIGSDTPRTKKDILIGAGYSLTTAQNPQLIEKTKGWQELMAQYLPEEKLAQVHAAGLEANKIISANITYGDADEKTNDFIEVPDHPTRYKFLELGYKTHNKLAPEKGNGDTNIQVNVVSFNITNGDNTTPPIHS